MIQRIQSWLDWLGEHTNVVLVGVLLVVLGTWAFIALADEVKEGDTQHFDNWAIRALRRADAPEVPIGPPWLAEVARDMTALGGVAVMALVTGTVAGFLAIKRMRGAMWLVVGSTAGGLIISTALKHVYHRPRPQLVAHLSLVYTSSFPSGHSMLSAVVYLTLGAQLARFVHQRRLKLYLMGVALLLTFLVGVSRVFMGVHYPTDVLAGWAAGLTWSLACWLVARHLQRRGAVEGEMREEHAERGTPAERRMTNDE